MGNPSFAGRTIRSFVSILLIGLLFISLFTTTPLPPASDFNSTEFNASVSAESSGQEPLIHSILVNGKDSGNLHLLPFQVANISALISHAEEANISLMLGTTEILSPSLMNRSGNQFHSSIMIPGSLSDLEVYEVLIRCGNANGTDSLRAGRVIRTNHLRVDTIIDPGTIHSEANTSVTIRTWKDEPVISGRFSVSMVSYQDAETFTTVDLGQHDISGSGSGSGSTTISHTLSFENLTLLKFDVDTVDDQRNYLGRSSSYALGVPFPVELSTDRSLIDLQGFSLNGPYAPASNIDVRVGTGDDIDSATLLIYRIDQLQDLIIEGDEPISKMDVELTNGSAEAEIQAPDTPGSYLMAARAERNGTTSIGMFSFVVQNISLTMTHGPALNRTDLLEVSVIPDEIQEGSQVSISIIGPSDLLLLSDVRADRKGDSYDLDYRIPVYAPNGTYHVVASYGEVGTFNTVSIAISNFTIIGGPVSPPPPIIEPPTIRDTDDPFPYHLVGLLFLVVVVIIYAMLSYRNWKTSSDSLSLGLHQGDSGFPEHPTKQTGHGDHPDNGGEEEEAKKESGGGEKIELGEGKGEEGEGAGLHQGDNDVPEEQSEASTEDPGHS